MARGVAMCEGSGGDIGVGVMLAERVDFCVLAVGFAIAGCWSMVSGAVVVLALRAFGLGVG